jgi:hypothetical protein
LWYENGLGGYLVVFGLLLEMKVSKMVRRKDCQVESRFHCQAQARVYKKCTEGRWKQRNSSVMVYKPVMMAFKAFGEDEGWEGEVDGKEM